MNTFPKVSVIVPVYNAGPYLNKCLQSLVDQTLKEIEIILVLDCPTDGSDDIAKSFAKKYTNIKLIENQVNSHIGISRNTGIAAATGEYIGFSDHDDYCSPNMFEELYLTAKNNHADVILSKINKLKISEQQTTLENDELENITPLVDHSYAEKCFLELVSSSQKDASPYIYAHLYRKQFLNIHNIHFVDTRYCSPEDLLFNFEIYSCLLEYGGQFVYLPKSYYFHIYHQNNTGATMEYREVKKLIAFLDCFHAIIRSSTKMSQAQLNQLFAERIVKNLFTAWRFELRYKGFVAFRNLNLMTDALRNTLKEYYKLYNPQLTFCKNCFALFLKIFYA